MRHLIIIACFGGSFLGTMYMRWRIGRSILMRENRRLRAWIEAQSKSALAFGPFRDADLMREPRTFVSMEVTHIDGRPVAPPPTTIPGPGRPQEE